MKVDLDDLERKARAATPGPWTNSYDPSHYDAPEVTDGKTFAYYVPHTPDAKHIAANSPQVTLALIARIRELEAHLERDADYDAIERQVLEGREAVARAILEKGTVLP